ncbi:zinc finger protein [Amycolatopsis sp. NPDC005232]|uniref:zinc finger protein n=1 Tax=Amycolatopsis sp. NPDC005232 TaxID=3157027 RepID=UPI0033AAEE3C
MYVWQQAAGQRHARAAVHHGSLDAGATFAALCGAEPTVGGERRPPPRQPLARPDLPELRHGVPPRVGHSGPAADHRLAAQGVLEGAGLIHDRTTPRRR